MALLKSRVSALLAMSLYAVAAVGAGIPADSLRVTILADTDRDGLVDTTGGRDFADKQTWSVQRGAIFLPNLADTDRRCSAQINASTPNWMLDRCHDASDNVLRNERLLAPVRTVPQPRVPDGALGSLLVEDAQAVARVRVFHKRAQGGWTYVDGAYTFSAQELRAGLELGVDGRDVRRPGVWDGRATLRLVVRDAKSGAQASDAVMMRVAPVLTHHHGQEIQQLVTADGAENPSPRTPHPLALPDQREFVENLGLVDDQMDFDDEMRTLHTVDVWAQDFMEPAYVSMPAPSPDGLDGDAGLVGLRVMLRSAQEHRRAGKLAFYEMRSAGVGAVQHAGRGDTQDSMGNLETVPPHSFKGRTWPAGRAVMGSRYGQRPLIMSFLQAQEEQDPIEIDTSWLYVGHVDEHIQFLPVDKVLGDKGGARGWVMMVADPLAGLEVLRKAQREANGGAKAMSRTNLPTDDKSFCVPTSTVDQVLAMDNLTQVQEFCATAISKNIEIIKRETGLTDAEIYRVPSLFYWDELPFISPGSSCRSIKTQEDSNGNSGNKNNNKAHDMRRASSMPQVRSSLYEERQKRLSVHDAGTPPEKLLQRRAEPEARPMEFGALYPSAINSIVSPKTREVIAPQQWGPVIQGRDVLQDAIDAVYAKVGYRVRYIDDWSSHHMQQGEVHCASNTLRAMEAPWWQ